MLNGFGNHYLCLGPLLTGVNYIRPVRGTMRRVISQVICSSQVPSTSEWGSRVLFSES